MKTILLVLVLCSAAVAQEQRSVLRPSDQSRDIERLIQQVERLTEAVARLEQLRGENTPVPEIELAKKVPGMWVMHPQTGMRVYAKSIWHRYKIGPVLVCELVQDGITPVPVGSVTYDAVATPTAYPVATPSPERADRLWEQGQRLR